MAKTLYIYSDKKSENENIYYVRYTEKHIIDEIMNINKNLYILFYIDHNIQNILLFEKFLTIVFSPYYIKRNDVYIFMCNRIILIQKIKKLLENIEKLI